MFNDVNIKPIADAFRDALPLTYLPDDKPVPDGYVRCSIGVKRTSRGIEMKIVIGESEGRCFTFDDETEAAAFIRRNFTIAA